MWGFPTSRGTFLGGPHNKDYSILGSILGYPDSGKLPYVPAKNGQQPAGFTSLAVGATSPS